MPRKVKRCDWVSCNPLYIEYHDKEWGVPNYDDTDIFESLILETFQAGLSWITILNKRKNFSKSFDNFDYNKISNYTEKEIMQLLNNKKIVRNRLKIEASITNAQAFIRTQKEFGSFSKYLWGFVNGIPIKNSFKSINQLPSSTKLSNRISNHLKKRGFKFVGPTIIYAHMQAIGMVNDHTIDCFRRNEI